MRAILIDDELACTETLAIELSAYCPEVEIIAKCNTAEDGLKAILKSKPDIVFLDIEMPWMNGFELLEQIPTINFAVIFVTAYDQFAIKAFRFSAVDYLLKPIDKSELIEAVQKVNQRSPENKANEQLQYLLKNIKHQNEPLPNIALPTMEGLDFIAVKDIIYCESDNNYTNLFQTNGKKILLSKPLKEIEAMLSEHRFFRTHQSFLVHLDHISKYIKGSGGYVVMSNGANVTVSRAKKEELLKLVRT